MSNTKGADGDADGVEKLAFKLSEAAAAPSISTVTVRRLVARGLLRPNKSLRHLIFARGELLRFVGDNQQGGICDEKRLVCQQANDVKASDLNRRRCPSQRRYHAATFLYKAQSRAEVPPGGRCRGLQQMLHDGWAGSMDGLVEQIEGGTVFVRLVDGQAWRFGLKQLPEVTTPHDWQGGIM